MRSVLSNAILTSLLLGGVAIAATPAAPRVPALDNHVMTIVSAKLDIPRIPHTLQMTVSAKVRTAGWKNGRFSPRVYIQPPPDGVYEVNVIADPPTGIVPQVITPMVIQAPWTNYPEAHLKGVKFIAATNSVTVMLPPVKP